MNKIPFRPEELNIVGEYLNTTVSFVPYTPIYNTPITVLDNLQRAVTDKSHLWFPTTSDILNIESRANKDHIARAEVRDLGPAQAEEEKGGPDLFGIEWVYVPVAGGSMVKPGAPTLEDANDWYDTIKFPDIDAMEWEAAGVLNAPFKAETRCIGCCFQNGMFERLISFMDFEGALIALVDEEQKQAVHDLFDKLADMYIAMIQKYIDILDVKEVLFHDDWGSQRAPFFSLEVCREMVVPYIRRISDFCHSKGLIFQLHSCGCNELLVPAMIEAGVDIWCGQPMNNKKMLYEKYGKDIILGVELPPVPEDADDETIEAAAKAFVEEYKEYPIMAVTRFCSQKYVEAVYRQSRIALCGE